MRSIGILLLSVMGIATTASAADRVPVAVSILPQATFVERVGGEHVDVTVMVGTGQSPHAYDPTPRQIAGLSRAKLYFRTGVGFEDGFMSRIERLYPKMRVIDLRDGIKLRKVEAECKHDHGDDGHDSHDGHDDADHEHGPDCDHDHGGHDHGDGKHGDHAADDHDHDHNGDGHKHEHKHAHDGDDPHVWLSPKLAKQQAKTICDALCKVDPGRSETYRANLEKFQAELDRVRDEIAKSLKPLKGKSVYVFHPAFGYFLDEFGLEQVPVELEGKQPSARQLARLIDQAKADGVRVIFVQPQFSPKSAQAVAEAIGGAVVPINPLAKEYTANLREIARKIREGLSPAKP